MAISNIRPASFEVASRGVTPGDVDVVTDALDARLDAVEAELVASRDGLTDLDTRLDAMRDAGQATSTEVVAAREGQASLDAKLDLMETATTTVSDEVVLARSGAASLDARIDAIATTATAAVPATRTIATADLATGGGDLTANRTITVAKATGAEAQAGTDDTKAVTPLALATPLGAIETVLADLSTRITDLYELVGTLMPPALILVSYGQSLARHRPAQVTEGVTISDYYMPVGGDDYEFFPSFSGNDAHLVNWDEFASWVPFHEFEGDGSNDPAEGWGSGLGYQFRRNPNYGSMTFFCPADGARDWRSLRGHGAGRWANMLSYIYNAYEYFHAQGELNIDVRFFWTQLESDCDTTGPGGTPGFEPVITTAKTVELLEQLSTLFHHDISIMLDKDMSEAPIYITPLNSAAYADATLTAPHPSRGAACRMAQAGQLQACQEDSTLILLPPHCQFWQYMDSDGIHLDGPGRRLYAELAASVAERIEAGYLYMAPHVLSATRSGAVITAICKFPGGSGGIRDTTTFADPGTTHWADQKYGIQFWKGLAFVNVSDATISGSTLTVTLASDPGAGAGELRIGQLPWAGTTAVNTWTPRCNFRDAALSVTAEDGTVLYHYMMPQTVQVA